MQEIFRALILTYKTAPVSVREQVSLNEEGVKRFLQFAKDFTKATDVMVVSTCNRTEIYYSFEQDLSTEMLKGLKLVKGTSEDFDSYFRALGHQEAIQHLYEVSIGLDAQVVGDLQISGQVKNAYQWSADLTMAGPFLHRLMHTIFYANKRVVQETSFRDGAASISYAAKELVEDLTTGIEDPKIVVLGVGEIGRDVAKNLSDSHFRNVLIVNRTVSKAEVLAQETGATFAGLDQLDSAIKGADVVISSVAGDKPIVTAANVQVGLYRHKYFIDLSVPRSIDPMIDEIPGVVVFNLDDLKSKTDAALERRMASIPDVRRIMEEAIADFNDWSREMIVTPTIQRLKQALEQIRKEELARFLKNADEKEAARLEEMSRSLMQKILKYPVLHLKAACRRGDAESLSELLLELFDLERINEKKS